MILDSLGVAEETPSEWAGAEDPKPIDVIAYGADYVFGRGDVVRISIYQLFQAGGMFISEYLITETGKISIPEVGMVEAVGLTETELEEEIKRILSPGILVDPSVTVFLVYSQQHTYSILGYAVPAPGRYPIPRYDFRLNDALAQSRVATQFNVSYIYVSRLVTGEEAIAEPMEAEPQEPEQLVVPEEQMLEIIAPAAKRLLHQNRLIITTTEMVTDKELAEAALPEGFEPLIDDNDQQIDEPVGRQKTSRTEWIFKDGKWVPVQVGPPEPPAAPVKVEPDKPAKPTRRETVQPPIDVDRAGRIEWIFQDVRWIPVQTGRPKSAEPAVKVEPEKLAEPLREKVPEDFEWDTIGTGGVQRRLIKIPTDKLASGDPRYNIVIRPRDMIQVPVDIIGSFWIWGNINYQGRVDFSGQPMTLKMAIAAAGGLGPLSWPKRCEVVRRVGRNREEIVMVDLDKIASGEQPDFFIKPNDLINVGTHPSARWRAVWRNAFYASYGLGVGFSYTRNFAYDYYYGY